ncbi:MAG: hypothetical protein IKU91_03550, partial [Anaerotignum sp.]|nr:hypothetical protein [Anaerotignum sp.]
EIGGNTAYSQRNGNRYQVRFIFFQCHCNHLILGYAERDGSIPFTAERIASFFPEQVIIGGGFIVFVVIGILSDLIIVSKIYGIFVNGRFIFLVFHLDHLKGNMPVFS